MKRYHEEKHIVTRRVKQFKQLAGHLGPQDNKYVPTIGKFRKTQRCAGCRQSRCYMCHSDKFPCRVPTKQERLALQDLKSPE